MVNRMKKRSNRNHSTSRLLAALLLLAISIPAWAAVELRLDRNQVMVGETVTLTFVTDDSRQSLDADFSALEGYAGYDPQHIAIMTRRIYSLYRIGR